MDKKRSVRKEFSVEQSSFRIPEDPYIKMLFNAMYKETDPVKTEALIRLVHWEVDGGDRTSLDAFDAMLVSCTARVTAPVWAGKILDQIQREKEAGGIKKLAAGALGFAADGKSAIEKEKNHALDTEYFGILRLTILGYTIEKAVEMVKSATPKVIDESFLRKGFLRWRKSNHLDKDGYHLKLIREETLKNRKTILAQFQRTEFRHDDD